MIYNLQPINAKQHQGDILLLYGDDTAARALPLAKKEIEHLNQRRSLKKDQLLVFDRLPFHLFLLSFDSEQPAPLCQEHLRRKAMDLLRLLEAHNVQSLAVTGEGVLPEEVEALVEGLTLADYSFDRYRSADTYHLQSLTIDSPFLKPDILEADRRLWNRILWCREWVNLPVQDLNAPAFADELSSIASDLHGVTCSVMDKKQIQSLRLGGLLAVNRGSLDEPRLVVLEYNPQPSTHSQPICLVGKGIMYDTGGLNIKPDDYMQEMKSDMAGAATMASVLFAAADNNLPVHIVAILPLTDNRPGFNAYAPDDIITMYDGTTVEIVNTDAEGRLILADAMPPATTTHRSSSTPPPSPVPPSVPYPPSASQPCSKTPTTHTHSSHSSATNSTNASSNSPCGTNTTNLYAATSPTSATAAPHHRPAPSPPPNSSPTSQKTPHTSTSTSQASPTSPKPSTSTAPAPPASESASSTLFCRCRTCLPIKITSKH